MKHIPKPDDEIQRQYLNNWSRKKSERKIAINFYANVVKADFKILIRHIKAYLKVLLSIGGDAY